MALASSVAGPFATLATTLAVNELMLENDPDILWREDWNHLRTALIIVLVQAPVLYISMSLILSTGESVMHDLRARSFQNLLRQEIGFFDDNKHSAGQLATYLSQSLFFVQQFVGEQLQQLASQLAALIASFTFMLVISFWQISILVIFGVLPAAVFAVNAVLKIAQWLNKASLEASRRQIELEGAILGEAVRGKKTVALLGQERGFCEKYDSALDSSRKGRQCTEFGYGLGSGTLTGVLTCGMAIIVYVANLLVEDVELNYDIDADNCASVKDQTLTKMMFPAMVMQSLIGQVAMLSTVGRTLGKLVNAGQKMIQILDRKSEIDSSLTTGQTLSPVRGAVEVREVILFYPTRKQTRVLNECNLAIPAGKVMALCGPSGSGKSTIIALVERFYDPCSGVVTLDGVDLKTLNVVWLRQQLGLVSQEPLLFSGSIAENIAYGKEGATRAEIEEAAKMANAHAFISDFTDQYDTEAGDGGGKLSGGQKQRVAIARAIVRRPMVLLLDEATSALDTQSERVVQKALDAITSTLKRTTIVIAHRLSTIRHADEIAVVDKGKVVEQGSHTELLTRDGHYTRLLGAQ